VLIDLLLWLATRKGFATPPQGQFTAEGESCITSNECCGVNGDWLGGISLEQTLLAYLASQVRVAEKTKWADSSGNGDALNALEAADRFYL
jgi:hypothetical protein